MKLKGTKSEENLKTAFSGESQARNKYTYFAQVAEKEGHEEIAKLFEVMALNESNHAKVWFKLLNQGFGDTEESLLSAAQGESYESSSMYPQFAREAREEGLEDLAVLFERVAEVERQHEAQFLETLMNLKGVEQPLESKAKKPAQRCIYCGYVHLQSEGEPPYSCPLCGALGCYENILV